MSEVNTPSTVSSDIAIPRWIGVLRLVLGLYAFLGGTISLLGWALDIPRLADWSNTGVSIQPNTCLAVMLIGAAIIFSSIGYRKLAAALGAVVLAIGVVSAVQLILHIDLGINTVLMFGRTWGTRGAVFPGQMGTPGTTSCVLLGAALILAGSYRKSFRQVAVTLAVIAVGIATLSLTGYFYGAEPLYTIPRLTVIALQTAVFVLVSSLGLIFCLAEVGPAKLLGENSAAGTLSRRVIPAIILVPIVLGYIRLVGERNDYYDLAFGTAARTLLEIALMLLLLAWTVQAVRRQSKIADDREQNLRALANAMPHVIWIADPDGSISYYNDRAANFGGITPGDHHRYDWQPGLHDDDRQPTLAAWHEAVQDNKVYEHEHRILMADGTFRWHLSRAVPVSDGNGYRRWYGTATDIDDIKAGERALRESEERFRLAQEAGNVGIWDWDIASKRTYWSEQMWTLYDEPLRAAEPDIEFWNSHLHPDDRKRALDIFERTVESGNDHHNDVYRILRKDNSVRWIESIATVERDAAGQPTRMYGVNLDITELQVAHDELEVRVVERTQELAKANTMLLQQMEERAFIEEQRIQLLKRLFTVQEDERGRIARDIHDHLGQRLTALRLKIASVRDLCEGNELLEQRVTRLQEISELLDKEVSFLAWELRPEILDKTDFVHALDQYVREWSRHSDVFAEFSTIGLKENALGPDIENNLYRITQEALNNAAKYAQATQINVILEQRDGELIVIIEDNGMGFDPTTVDGSNKMKGFGLVGMRERASLIGGTIEIESAPGEGTTIFVKVPYRSGG